MKICPHQLLVACVVVYGAPDLSLADDDQPAAKPAQPKSQLTASEVQPAFEAGASPARQGAGFVNDWLRSQSSLFSAWDIGGKFRARYEHVEHLGGAADFSASGNSSDNLLLLRTFVH